MGAWVFPRVNKRWAGVGVRRLRLGGYGSFFYGPMILLDDGFIFPCLILPLQNSSLL